MKKYIALGLAILLPCLHGVAQADIQPVSQLQRQLGRILGRHGHGPAAPALPPGPMAPFPGPGMEPHPGGEPHFPPQAGPHPEGEPNFPQHTAQAPRISLAEASRIVQQSTGGRILEARPQNVGGRMMYRIKVLSNNEVRIVMVDAETGAME